MLRCAWLALAVAVLAAQTAPAVSGQQPLRVTTRMVEVSVVAETSQGEPVSDLRQEDLRLLDEGREQQIAFFTPASALGRPARRRPAPGAFSNRPEEAGAPASLTVILFDGLNTRITDQAYARRQVVRFLEQLREGDRVALYVLGRGPRILQDFTGDPAVLLRALRNYTGEPSPTLDAPLYDPVVSPEEHFGAWLAELSFNLIDYFEEDRAFRTARSLIAIANHLERLPGRKNLIWVSGSFPISIELDQLPRPSRSGRRPRSISPEVERAARALNNANLAVYPVDARGLIAPQEYRADLSVLGERIPGRDQAMFATMRLLAQRTGGRAFYNNNDLVGAMRRAAADAGRTYLIGYYPSHNDWNGRFRQIKVEVRRPGVVLYHRGGYFAQPEEPDEAWYRERVLESAIWSPMDATRIGLAIRPTLTAPSKLDLDIEIDAPDVVFRPAAQPGLFECRLDVWMVQLDRREQQLQTVARINNLRLNEATYRRVMEAGGLRLIEHLDLAPEATILRVLVRDITSGNLGTVTVPVRRLVSGGAQGQTRQENAQ